ncbi:MAG: rod shape-determining protein MreC [Minisyncoccota bacterium]
MKATYRRDNLPAKKKFLTLTALVLLSVLVLSYGPVRSMISRTVYLVAPGVWELGGITASRWNIFWGEFRLKRSLVYENSLLREELARMQVQVLDRNLLEEHVRELEEKLGRAGSDDRVAARVLSGAGRAPYDTLIVDAGTDQDVLIGDRVVYAGMGVIGTVAEAYPDSAKVVLFSSPGEEVTVVIGEQAIPAVARGRGMGNFEAKIPQGSAVFLGENVLVDGGDLILGTVGAIEEEPSEPFMRVYFRTPFNIATVRSVEVIKNKR